MIKFNGVNLEDFGIIIHRELDFSIAESDVEFVEVPGLDGDVAISRNRLKGITRSFPFTMSSDNIDESIGKLADFLKKDSSWHELEWSRYPEHVYLAMYHEEIPFASQATILGKGVLNFRMKPTKKLKTGLKEVSLDSSITNSTNRASKPLITIKGTGNMSLQIGKHKLDLKNVDSGLIIDVETGSVTDLTGKRNQYDKVVNYPFPVIEPGKQTILKTGNITSVTVVPRWEVVAT